MAATVGGGSAARGRSVLPTVALGLAVLLVVLVGGSYVYDHSRRDVIAKGVSVDGVAVGGLHEAAARRKLEDDVVARLHQPLTVRSGAHAWTLAARDAGIDVDVPNVVSQAVSASRGGSFISRTARGVFGGSVKRDIPLVVSYSRAAVRGLTKRIRAVVNREPRDATVQPSASGLGKVRGRVGLRVDSPKLGGRIESTLVGDIASRTLTVPTQVVQPKVSTAQLAAKYPAYIVVDRGDFRLKFYDHLKLAKTYEIAVGMEGLETPPGLHHIEWKQVDPPWYVPKKAWAGKLAGTVVPPGPGDPLKARFMSFEGGAGIHGIDPSEYSSIGHDASHGCVRMRIPDVIDLYDRSPVGTPVYIM
ncbi:MAG TPA: L,D-transpeptidase/peptidoglycan binding protein [Solirubrobacteraceae bacterium]|nr:L,D-transpeptidase/peptidoglycan binding protein [Solirubrobacteraceae bacterium]